MPTSSPKSELTQPKRRSKQPTEGGKVRPAGRSANNAEVDAELTKARLKSCPPYEQPDNPLDFVAMYISESRLPPKPIEPNEQRLDILKSLKSLLPEEDYFQVCESGIYGKPLEPYSLEKGPSDKQADKSSSAAKEKPKTTQRSKSTSEQLTDLRSAVENVFPTIFKTESAQSKYNDLVKSSDNSELDVGRMLPMHILDFENYLSVSELREFHSELYYSLAAEEKLSIFNFYDVMSKCFKNQLAHRALLSSDMRNKGMLTQFLTCYHKANEAQIYIQTKLGLCMIESLIAGADLLIWINENLKAGTQSATQENAQGE